MRQQTGRQDGRLHPGKESAMIVWGMPREVKTFFSRPVADCSKPIRHALATMVLAFLLAPHRRCLKTIAGEVLGHRCHVATISRRLTNPQWRTRDWYVKLYDGLLSEVNAWERREAKGERRQWIVVIDTTYHSTLSEKMENRLVMSKRKDPARQTTYQHAFVMGLILTDRGARIPLPRKSYYTKDYCRKHKRRFRTTIQLAAAMIRELRVPDDVDVLVTFDSAFDAGDIHKACRKRHFHAVFPLDPNRVLARTPEQDSAWISGDKVVEWVRHWPRKEFALLELAMDNEDHVFARRRHADNLRVKKTRRQYAVAARHATVSKLGDCLIVASYKENPKVQLQPGQSAEWWSYHRAPISYRQEDRHKPARWHRKVLACTDPTATARQVVEWYEVRWQVELFFRELKSRMQFECYVLMKFEAVERYLDLLLMGLLLLEQQRLRDMQRDGPEVGAIWVQARTTDRLRMLETYCQRWNVRWIEERLRTDGGRRRLLRELRCQPPCQVA
jgi:hypothetical protein